MSLVLVMVGTDHHPFNRLIDWADLAAGQHPEHRFVVQHGDTRAPRVAEGYAFLPHQRVGQLLREADGVVCHGGPGTLMDARDMGHVPICVPRDPGLGEHVDGHQQRFARLMDQAGVVDLVNDVGSFERAVAQILTPRSVARPHTRPVSQATSSARELLAHELDLLIEGRVPRQRWARAHSRAGRPPQA